MITNFNTYIKENNNQNIIIENIIDDINNELFDTKIDYHIHDYQFEIIYLYTTLNVDSFLSINKKEKYVVVYNSNFDNETFFININDKIYKTLKEMIIKCLIIEYLYIYAYDENVLVIDFLNDINNEFNLKINVNELISNILKYKDNFIKNLFVKILKDKLLTKDIQKEYEYLIDANNFDLI